MTNLAFDTSAINALSADPECEAIVRGMRAAYLVAITETVLAEVAAHPVESKRLALLGLIERLLKFGICVLPYHVIIEEQAKAYQSDPSGYEWRRVNVRFPEAEGEVVRQEIIHRLSDETRETLRQWDKDFRAIFSTARPAFQKLFEEKMEERPSLKAVTDHLMSGGGAYLSIGAGLMERATRILPKETEVKVSGVNYFFRILSNDVPLSMRC